MKAWRVYLRSVPGQLALLAIAFAGAAGLAAVPAFFRESYFENGAEETYLALGGYAEQAARALASPATTDEEREKVYDELVKRDKKVADPRQRWKHTEAIYGAWIQGDVVGDEELLARQLMEFQPNWVLNRLKQTLAVGSEAQRRRAVAFLGAVADEEGVIELARAAEARARRRGETELADQARAVRERGGAQHGR